MPKKKAPEGVEVNMQDLVSQTEAAKLRGVTRSAIHRLIKRGKLRSIEIGGHVFLFRSEVENYKPEAGGRPRKSGN